MKNGRRGFLLNLLIATGLGSSGAMLAAIVARFLYPRQGLRRVRQIYIAPLSDLPAGKALSYELPDGGTALVTNTGTGVVALSDTCPHLGCKVHWEENQRRFVCPCHGGVFDKEGTAIAGPPADEKKNLKRYAVARVGDHLFFEIEERVQA